MSSYIVDVSRGWGFGSAMIDTQMAAMTTTVKYYHCGFGCVLGAADLFALQGFDPAKLDFTSMSYSALAHLAGSPPPKEYFPTIAFFKHEFSPFGFA